MYMYILWRHRSGCTMHVLFRAIAFLLNKPVFCACLLSWTTRVRFLSGTLWGNINFAMLTPERQAFENSVNPDQTLCKLGYWILKNFKGHQTRKPQRMSLSKLNQSSGIYSKFSDFC